ncbi:SGNH/GDSL hydrolase family protein [Paractinoplanes ferrugineus]|uniref:SGNH hydrolase n=1 Tax=Paractinoplanes ferrugineus TaxID=113564 RepID=A0A919M8E1_9ACTN|nr:GDSL-type esterase/lipase family protein [Actinoplanes ferrugineus]GIE10381.1 SGNH hydrolase [Actinoplanes ferrugineus]
MRWTRAALVMVLAVAGCAATERPAQPAARPSAGRSAGPVVAPTPEPGWVGTWAAGVQSGRDGFKDQTLRQIVHTSIGGDRVRLRVSNEFGGAPLTVTGVGLAHPTGGAGIDLTSARAITFGGADSVTVAAGAEAVSDEVAFTVRPDTDLTVSMYLPEATGAPTEHVLANRTNYAAPGNQFAAAGLRESSTTGAYYFLSGLDVHNTAASGAVVAFGASVTDGLASKAGTNQRWPDLLADRLRQSGRTVAVLNTGISGNRLLTDGPGGDSALKRFDRDVLTRPGARWVIISDEPANDLGNDSSIQAGELTGALRELVDRAHGAGLEVICSTLTQASGADYWSAAAENGRAAYNAFVRGSTNGCDAVLDLDAATRDPAAPTRLRPSLDSGDHLHPNTAGMKAIADAVDLTWFG